MAKVWLGIEKEYQLKHEVLVVPRVHGDFDSHVKAVTRGGGGGGGACVIFSLPGAQYKRCQLQSMYSHRVVPVL